MAKRKDKEKEKAELRKKSFVRYLVLAPLFQTLIRIPVYAKDIESAIQELDGVYGGLGQKFHQIAISEYPYLSSESGNIPSQLDDAGRHIMISAYAYWKHGESLGLKVTNGHEIKGIYENIDFDPSIMSFFNPDIPVFLQIAGAMDFYNNRIGPMLIDEMERQGIEITEESIIRASLNLVCQSNTPVITNQYKVLSDQVFQKLDRTFADILGAENISAEFQQLNAKEVIQTWSPSKLETIDLEIRMAVEKVIEGMPRKDVFNEQYVTDKTFIVLPEFLGKIDNGPTGIALSPQTPKALQNVVITPDTFVGVGSDEVKSCETIVMQDSYTNHTQLAAPRPIGHTQADALSTLALSSLVFANAAIRPLKSFKDRVVQAAGQITGKSH